MKNIQTLLCVFFASCISLFAQTPFPDQVVEGVNWTAGNYTIAVPQRIVSPYTSASPVNISGQADVDFLSATEVDLKDGFHAGTFSSNHYFHAAIQPSLNLDMVLVNPDTSHISNGMVHIEKWEKFEVAFKLPQDYETAINNFFNHYYNYDGLHNPINTATDLNPYADDSMVVEVHLTSPTGRSLTRWAYFMREAKWGDSAAGCGAGSAWLEADNSHPLKDYHWHFRFAPDEENSSVPWTFSISISSPFFSFTPHTYSGFRFICDSRLADNKGYLHVNPANNRYLVFDHGETFFPLGEVRAEHSHGFADPACYNGGYFYKRDFDDDVNIFDDLHSSGGNYTAIQCRPMNFNPEWENLGIYDDYGGVSNSCFNSGINTSARGGNRQYNCWMLDKLIDKAREDNIYIQLNVDPNTPLAYQYYWGSHCYIQNFVYPYGNLGDSLNPFDFSKYFISEDYTNNSNWMNESGGSFYYWKRKYKYILSRWGYSTNIAMIETFREIDQTLGYYDFTTTDYHEGWCAENSFKRYDDFVHLKNTLRKWHDVMLDLIKNTWDNNGFTSGTTFNHLCTVSYTGGLHNMSIAQYEDLLSHPLIDVTDVHSYDDNIWMNRGRWELMNDNQIFANFPDKPFHIGEGSSFAYPQVTIQWPWDTLPHTADLTSIFNNYETTFHNEIWATAFMGCLQPVQTWQSQIVHWLPESMPVPLPESFNIPPTNMLGANNKIQPNNIADPIIPIENKTLFHHYQPLSDFFTSTSGIDLNDNFIPKTIFDQFGSGPDDIECYYLVKNNGTGTNDHAYGWVHNKQKYWGNHWYHLGPATAPNDEKYFYCTNSPSTTFTLKGLDPTITNYDITFLPTYVSGQTLPTATCTTLGGGDVLVSVQSNFLGCGPIQHSLSTTAADADVAFVVHPLGHMRLAHSPVPKTTSATSTFDVNVFPNPGTGVFNLSVPYSNETFDLVVYDATGRMVLAKNGIADNSLKIDLTNRTKGIYYIRIIKSNEIRFKKLVLQ